MLHLVQSILLSNTLLPKCNWGGKEWITDIPLLGFKKTIILISKAMSKISAHKKKYLAYLQSKQWSEIKADLLIIRGSKCERCHKKYKRGSALHLHHLTYKNLFNEEPEDLELLCSKCHRKEHYKKPKKKSVKVKAKKTKKSKKAPTWYPDRKK